MAVTFIGAGVAICGCSSPANNPPDKIENPGDNTGGEQNPENPGGGLVNGGIFEGH